MNLREIRKSKGMTMKQLGKLVGVTESAIGLWETGKREPNQEMLLKLGEALDCSVLDIMGADTVIRIHRESPIVQKYNALDKHGKTVVDFVLEAEYQRCAKTKEVKEKSRTKVIPLFSAAAGPGEPPSQDGFEDYEVDEDSPARFAVKISGDSMEPELHDGDIVLCRRKRPEIGELAVMMVNGAIYVKQYITDGINIYLRSINRKRKDLDVDIWSSGNDTVVGYGTVIHKKIPLVMQ